MERQPKKVLPSHVEFAGTTSPDGRIRIERCGADSQRDWAISLPGQAWSAINLEGRTLAKMILRDVFGRAFADQWHDVFEREVIERFGRHSFRITAAEVSAWHLEIYSSRVPVL